jgi:hypothetical protein
MKEGDFYSEDESFNMADARKEANCSTVSRGQGAGDKERNWVSNAGPLSLSCRPVNPFFPSSLACSLLGYGGIMTKRGDGRLIEMRSNPAK